MQKWLMARVLGLARKGEGHVSPNPLVGALLQKGGKIIAEGYHKKFGGPHAERVILEKALRKGISLHGAQLYVNLEPCIHDEKKTPPCVPLILKSGISKVVIAMKDPHPQVNGRGIRALKNSGVAVDLGCLKEEAFLLNEKFVTWVTTGRPFIGMKVAMSLDGKIATKTGDSHWITSEKSRAYVHELRDAYDAILIGKNTVIHDNPTLAGKKREPLRIILDSFLQIPLSSRVLRDHNVLVVTTKRGAEERNRHGLFQKRGIPLKIFPRKIILAPLLHSLGKRGISSIFVEGGSEIFGSFLDAKLVDRFYWFIAPKIIGGREAVSAIGGRGISSMKQALQISPYGIKKIGPDIFLSSIR